MEDDYELQEFLRRVEDVSSQVRGLVDGRLAPDDVKLPSEGRSTWAAAAVSASKPDGAAAAASATRAAKEAAREAAEAEERRRARELQAKWDAERAASEAAEERRKWWVFARMQYGDRGINGLSPPEDGEAAEPAPAHTAEQAEAARRAASERAETLRRPGGVDYSWWDKWARDPDDPVTREEEARLKEEEARRADEAFERANPGFVAMFNKDRYERLRAEERKRRQAEAVKGKGNAAFAAGEHARALVLYHDAVRLCPFLVPALNNIGACHLALGNFDGALEFCSRVLHVEPLGGAGATKALFRRAHAHRAAGRLAEAEADLALAARHDTSNGEVLRALDTARLELAEAGKEARVKAAAAAGGAAGSSGSGDAAEAGVGAGRVSASSGGPVEGEPAAGPEAAEARTPAVLAKGAVGGSATPALVGALLECFGGGAGEGSSGPAPPAPLTSLCAKRQRAVCRGLSELSARMEGEAEAGTEGAGTAARGASVATPAEEARVLCRSSGLLESVCRGLVTALRAAIHAAVESPASSGGGGSFAGPAGPAPAPLHSTLGTVCAALLCAAASCGNRLNRGLVRTAGLLSASLDFLSLPDSDMARGVAAAWEGRGGATPAASALLPLVSACLTLADTFARPRGDPEGRVHLTAHPFIAGRWRPQESLRLKLTGSAGGPAGGGAAPAPTAPGAAASAAPGSLDLVGRLNAAATALVAHAAAAPDPVLLEVAGACACVLQHLPLTDTTPVAVDARAKAAAATGLRSAAPVDPFLPHHELVAAVVDGFADAPAAGAAPAGVAGASAPSAPPAPPSLSGCPVLALLRLVAGLLLRSVLHPPVLGCVALQAAAGALANLARRERLRPAFASPVFVPTPAPAGKGAGAAGKGKGTKALALPESAPALLPLLDLLRLHLPAGPAAVPADDPFLRCRVSALGALANATLGCEPVVTALGQCGAPELLAELLLGAPAAGGKAAQAAAEGVVRAHAALLLGRLSSLPSTCAAFSHADRLNQLLDLLDDSLRRCEPPATAGKAAAGAPSPAPAATRSLPSAEAEAEGQFQDGVARIVAAACVGPVAPELLPVLSSRQRMGVLVRLIRQALPSLTPKPSSTGPRVRSAAVGNTCKLLGLVAALPDAPATLLAVGGCDALVAVLMATAHDALAPVQKNAAVALARLTPHAGCYERIRELRGIEVMMQLSGKLTR